MANFFETSFVPQQPLVKVEAGTRRPERINAALVLALVLFFVTLALAGGMYFWEKSTALQVKSTAQELADKESILDINKINSYKELQVTLRNAKSLVDEHTIFSVMLDNIENNAAQNIGLTQLSYSEAADGASLSLSGQAPNYKGVYFQVEKWRLMQPLFQKVDVTSLALSEQTGIVNFAVSIMVDPKVLDFSKYLESSGALKALPVIPAATVTPPPSSAQASSSIPAMNTEPNVPHPSATPTKK